MRIGRKGGFWLAGWLLWAAGGLSACGGSDASSEPPTPDGDAESVVEAEADSEEADSETVSEGPWDAWSCHSAKLGDMLGVATHMRQDATSDADRDFEFARYDELANPVIREHFRWDDLEPADGEYHFDEVETQVQMAQAHKVRLIAQVGYDVSWAETGTGDTTLIPEKYGAFTSRVATEYCGRVNEFELWNEPDMSTFWEPTPDPTHYGLLVKQAYPAIKAACPQAIVSLGGMASYSDVDRFNRWWFLRELFKVHPDIVNYFDVISLHPYTFMMAQSPEQDILDPDLPMEGQARMVAEVRDLLTSVGKGAVPIWFTEIGWSSLLVKEAAAARYLSRSALLAARDNIQYYLWYTFFDKEPDPSDTFDNWSNYFGLFGWPGDATEPRREKPAWLAMKGLTTVLGDACYAADFATALQLPNDVYVLGYLRADGTQVVAAWDGREKPDEVDGVTDVGGANTSYDLTLPLPAGTTQVRVLDQTGAVTKTEAASVSYSLTLGSEVTFLEIGAAR